MSARGGGQGMAATNVAFPLTIVTIALALMIGDGCAANMSLCLGRRQQEADRTASHTVTLLVAAGVFLAVAGKPVRPADCPAVRGPRGGSFSGVSGLYPDHRLGGCPSCSLALPSRPLSGRTATPNTP